MNTNSSTAIRRASCASRALAAAAAIIALLIACFAATPAHAADNPTIRFDGAKDAETLELLNAPGDNLFPNFTAVVPGDEIDQPIVIDLQNIQGATRVYVKAQADAQTAQALADTQLSATLPSGQQVQPAEPTTVFQNQTLVYETDQSGTAELRLTLTVPPTVGNEVAGLSSHIQWIITVEYEGEAISTGFEPHALDLTAYEGGSGTDQTDGADGMPQPAWSNISVDTPVTVDGQAWDIATQGMPFQWMYAEAASGDLVRDFAHAGLYRLMIAPLEGDHEVLVDGKPLVLPADGVVTTEDGSDVITEVRDVTDNAAAATNDSVVFKGVFETQASSALASAASLIDGLIPSAYAAPADVEFNEHGTIAGDCGNALEPHAHVQAGTKFLRNGNAALPVNDGARIGLLWDEFLPEVLGSPERMEALNAKALAATGDTFAADDQIQNRFKYLDLVDMNDGNVWVSTADGSAVSVFVPYSGTFGPNSKVAVVGFDGLTRDYTLDMASADLDAEIAKAGAWEVEVTRASDGILFEVPTAQFGPFEMLWTADDGGGEPSQPDDGTGDGDGDGSGNDGGKLPSHTNALTKTGDSMMLTIGVAAAVAIAAIVLLVIALGRRRKQH